MYYRLGIYDRDGNKRTERTVFNQQAAISAYDTLKRIYGDLSYANTDCVELFKEVFPDKVMKIEDGKMVAEEVKYITYPSWDAAVDAVCATNATAIEPISALTSATKYVNVGGLLATL